jgi:hypothetical protein
MNMERTILRGKLAELKARQIELILSIRGNLAAVQALLAGWSVTRFEEVDIQSAHQHIGDAARAKADLLAVLADIAQIEQELI